MSAVISAPYAPNKVIVKDSNAVSTWFVVASDGSGYASLASLASAGKVAWPGLDPGMFLQTVTARSEGATGADGSAFYIALNQATQPASDLVGELVSAGNNGFIFAGSPHNVWIRKTVATDKVILLGAY